jgi:TATA-binding protein-associated factor Taf7
MARRSLKPQLNQIRAWVRQGRTDAWIAHQLEVPASELREFRKQHDLNPDSEDSGGSEIDLRDEIEAEVEAATAEEAEEEADEEESEDAEDEEAPARKSRQRKPASEDDDDDGEESGEARPRRRRRRGRRGGRGRRKELEATFDHGERDGYGLWLDPAVKDNPVYAERWAGKREVTVRIEADQIVIRRAGDGAAPGDDADTDE